MPRRWTKEEEKKYRRELILLYVEKNLAIREVAERLGLAEQTVFKRLQRLGVTANPKRKLKYLNRRGDITIPNKLTDTLAEFFGIMLGDGHLSHFQVMVTLGNKEEHYAQEVAQLIKILFAIDVKILVRKGSYRVVYFGSVAATSWLKKMGLVFNKVRTQVDAPKWIFSRNEFMEAFMRGFFDTDGSIYTLKSGAKQISLTNHSLPLLNSLQKMLVRLKYNPSRVSGYHVYLTRGDDVRRFFREIKPRNQRHLARFS